MRLEHHSSTYRPCLEGSLVLYLEVSTLRDSRYGNGYGVSRAAEMRATIDGADGSWRLPLPPLLPDQVK